nr:hypothetical protein [Solirubrobacterales bacterium]
LRRTATGARFTRMISVRVPRDLQTGTRTIKLEGTDADAGADPEGYTEVDFLFGADAEEEPPQTIDELREAIEGLERYDGVTATIGGRAIRAHRDPNLRISGDARVTVRIRR